jgi:competence protein ComEC
LYSLFTRFPFLRIASYWIIGILLAEKLHPVWHNILIVLSIILVVFFLFFKRLKLWASTLVFGLFLGVSFLYNSLTFSQQEQQSFEQNQAFVFRVLDIPQLKPQSWSMIGEMIAIKKLNKWRRCNGKLKIYLPKNNINPKQGDLFISIASIKPISASLFPNEQNWKLYYQRKSIYGNVFIKDHEVLSIHKASKRFVLNKFFFDIQQRLSWHLSQNMKSERNKVVAAAMLLGARSSIDFDTIQSYASLGAIHILSVSGMHVGLLYMGLSLIFGFLLKRGKWGSWLFFILMMLLLWLYAGISGFSAPVLRSAWMFSLMLFAKSFGFQQNTINILAFSCFVLLIADPNNLFQSGFQLSYLAVLGLLLYQAKISGWLSISLKNQILRFLLKNVWDLTAVAIAAQIFTLPFVVYYFHQMPHPFYFFLLNPLLIFLSSISLCLGLLFVSISELLYQLHLDWFYFNLGFLLDKSFDLLHWVMFFVVKGVNPVISFIQIEHWEIVCILIFLLIIEAWIVFRNSYLLYVNATILLLLLGYHLILIPQAVSKQKIMYFSHYKGDLVVIQIQKAKATILGSARMHKDGPWIQSHLSPLCAFYHVKDTLMVAFKSRVNLSWKFKNKRFCYLQIASEKIDTSSVNVLFLGNRIKWKNAYWLKSWRGTSWYFLKSLSPYYQKQMGDEIRRNRRGAIALDTCAAISY